MKIFPLENFPLYGRCTLQFSSLITSKSHIYCSLQGASEKCKFVVRQVTDRPLLRYGVITLESAIHPEWTIAVTSNGRTRNCKQAAAAPVKPDEARLMVRAEVSRISIYILEEVLYYLILVASSFGLCFWVF